MNIRITLLVVLAAVTYCYAACGGLGCAESPSEDCRHVVKVRPNGEGCEPVCHVCNDTAYPTKTDLACPRDPYFFGMVNEFIQSASEPEIQSCDHDYECKSDEKCCYSGNAYKCTTGTVIAPKLGTCPAVSSNSSVGHHCRMDYVGCGYDSECSGNDKCCRVEGCFYSECMTPQEYSQPSTPPATPPAAPTEEIVCPIYPFYFNVPPHTPPCKTDSDCESGEKCCFWGEAMQCKQGVLTAAKPGSCPAVNLTETNDNDCLMDYVGCAFDSECDGDKKCCPSDVCRHYHECRSPATLLQAPSQAPPQSPTSTELPKACTLKGCGAPPAGPDCLEVEVVYPNGEGCEPACRICKDRPTTPTVESVTIKLKACTEIGCGPKPGKDCKKVKRFRPNGKGCRPVCKVCADEDEPEGLVCPRLGFPFYYIARPSDVKCTDDGDCGTGEKCCFWGRAGKLCKTGIDTTPKPGSCPNPRHQFSTLADSIPLEPCKMDYSGCRYDSECSGNRKCCKMSGCGYRECTSPAATPPVTPPVTPSATPPATNPVTPPEEIVCPSYPFYFNVPPRTPPCKTDSDCKSGKKCCFWGEAMQCKQGVLTAAKPGSCPAVNLTETNNDNGCLMDYVGCSFDSQCDGNKKCCPSDGCHYHECRAPATLLQAPSQAPPQSPTSTEGPKACTLKGCGAPPAGPDCLEVEVVYPNGEGCEPACRICKDRPTTPTMEVVTKKACTEIGCPAPPNVSCKKIKKFRPNGKGCGPVCYICADKSKGLACPTNNFWFDAELTKPNCTSDDDCKTGDKCCWYGSGKQCAEGIDMTPKNGQCPAFNDLNSVISNSCKMDYGGCQYDSECGGAEKCCLNQACKYKECKPAVNVSCHWVFTKRRCHPTKRRPNGRPKCRRMKKRVCV